MKEPKTHGSIINVQVFARITELYYSLISTVVWYSNRFWQYSKVSRSQNGLYNEVTKLEDPKSRTIVSQLSQIEESGGLSRYGRQLQWS